MTRSRICVVVFKAYLRNCRVLSSLAGLFFSPISVRQREQQDQVWEERATRRPASEVLPDRRQFDLRGVAGFSDWLRAGCDQDGG